MQGSYFLQLRSLIGLGVSRGKSLFFEPQVDREGSLLDLETRSCCHSRTPERARGPAQKRGLFCRPTDPLILSSRPQIVLVLLCAPYACHRAVRQMSEQTEIRASPMLGAACNDTILGKP